MTKGGCKELRIKMESIFRFNARRLWRLCLRCAWELDQIDKDGRDWRNIVIDSDLTYRLNTAKLLLGTAAQESNFIWERQRSPQWDGIVGGFSKWQVERGSIERTMKDLISKDHLVGRCYRITQFLFADLKATDAWLALPLESILWMLRLNDNDYLGIMFAREHYRRVPKPIPSTVEEQADYWKRYYNSFAGKGTIEEYLQNWERYCIPAITGA